MLVELCPETVLWAPSRWDGEVTLYCFPTETIQTFTGQSLAASIPMRPDQQLEGLASIAVSAWTSFVMYGKHYLFEVEFY